MDPWMIAHIALWCVVGVLSLLVFALMRQIGVLNERVFPAGALMTTQGPQVGELTPVISAPTLGGKNLTLGGPSTDQRETLLLFISPTCPICKTLLPYVQKTAEEESTAVQVIYASDGHNNAEKTAHHQLIRQYHLNPDHYVLSQALGLTYAVEKLPFAVLIDHHGLLRAKGMVNSREHLESLFEARTRGVASLQEYLLAKR